MAKRLIKRYLPDVHKVRNHKYLRLFGEMLHDPNLWHLNRHSVSDGFAIGLFMTFIPIPFQTIPAAALAILFHANLPIAVVLVWITNPFTMLPIFYFSYKVGTWVLGSTPQAFTFEMSWPWLAYELGQIWLPFLLGSLLVASTASLIGYFGMHQLWRWRVVRNWEKRKKARSKRKR